MLYDAGIKTKDACTLRWKDLTFDDNGLYLKTINKAKFLRNDRCVANDFLVTWRNKYPGEPEGDNFVFITEKGDPFTNQLAFRILGRIAKESGITKPVQLHLLKQSKGLHHKTAFTEEETIKKMLWEIV